MDDKLLAIVAELTTRVTQLEQEVLKLKEGYSVEGVYLDGSPDYVKKFVNLDKGGNS